MDIFTYGLGILIVACVALYYYTRTTSTDIRDANFSRFQHIYLVVYLLAMRKIQPQILNTKTALYF